jgi:hypothetical protein
MEFEYDHEPTPEELATAEENARKEITRIFTDQFKKALGQ